MPAGTAAGFGRLPAVVWRGQYPGHYGSERQPPGTESQLSPADDGGATNRRGVPWVSSPFTGLVHESEARSPRTGPRSHAEPSPAKLGEPGNQHWNSQHHPRCHCQISAPLTTAGSVFNSGIQKSAWIGFVVMKKA